MKKTYRVGIIGCTGMVGQRFMLLLSEHPFFSITALAASKNSAGKPYHAAVKNRWYMDTPIPTTLADLPVYDADADFDTIISRVDLVFCSVNMKKEDILALETRYAKAECPVISNNKEFRGYPDVPMIIPEINADHADIIPVQRKRLGTKKGFIAVKSNCSIQSYVPALHPLKDFGISKVLACTYQAISGAGKTFETCPEIIDNVIPYIGGEEEKSEQEPLKVWGHIQDGRIINAVKPDITTQCLRVPVSDGHMAAVYVTLEQKEDQDEIIRRWKQFKSPIEDLHLPSAPTHFLRYFDEPDRPQTKLDRNIENGMTISIGRLRPDTQYDYKFVCLSHNTLRGAAGGAVLMAELLCKKGYFESL